MGMEGDLVVQKDMGFAAKGKSLMRPRLARPVGGHTTPHPPGRRYERDKCQHFAGSLGSRVLAQGAYKYETFLSDSSVKDS